MATFLTGDEKYPDRIHDDDYRSYLITRRETPSAIASAKLRRMERELEFRGIRFDRPHDNWVARQSQPTERS
jgi:hypothetical protein